MKIIYTNDSGGVSVVIPAPQALQVLTVDAIAKLSVPQGVAYWVVEDDAISDDRSQRDSWQLDGTQGKPDGYGEQK